MGTGGEIHSASGRWVEIGTTANPESEGLTKSFPNSQDYTVLKKCICIVP